MTQERLEGGESPPQEDKKEKGRGQVLLTVPAKKLRMSRRKVEH
jgi:hypothetical protein